MLLINQKLVSNPEDELSEYSEKRLKEIAEIPYMQDEKLFLIYGAKFEQAAKLGCLIATRKPFKQENNKTALLALLITLDINGVRIVDYENDLTQLLEFLQQDDLDGTTTWIKTHLPGKKENDERAD